MNSKLDSRVNRFDFIKYFQSHFQWISRKGFEREDPQDDASACIEKKLTNKCAEAGFLNIL